MPRVKIELPERFVFTTVIPVRITDLNYGGHVGNDSILSLLVETRVQYLKHYGYGELDFAGAALIMSDVAIEFRKEIFYGDAVKRKRSQSCRLSTAPHPGAHSRSSSSLPPG